jgi:hypothetical protein
MKSHLLETPWSMAKTIHNRVKNIQYPIDSYQYNLLAFICLEWIKSQSQIPNYNYCHQATEKGHWDPNNQKTTFQSATEQDKK